MLALKEERKNASESIFRRCYDYAVTLGKSLDIEPDMLKIAWIIDGLFTRFDKYGSMIYKIHAFVPSVIGMRKVEGNYKIEEIIHVYKDDLPTPRNAFQ